MKLNFLRSKAKASDRCQTIVREELNAAESESDNRKLKHINFFQDLEDGTAVSIGGNEKYLEDKKNEQEKYEKQIGYLTYLGQDTNESLGECSNRNCIFMFCRSKCCKTIRTHSNNQCADQLAR